MNNEITNTECIKEYNGLLAGEISAIETYDLAIKSATDEPIKLTLCRCQHSHADRAEILSVHVRELGGAPASSSGVWGPFAAFCQKGANSQTDAIALLEQSEAERLVQYEAQQNILISPVLEVLTGSLLPAQHETHLTMSTLLKSMQPEPVQ